MANASSTRRVPLGLVLAPLLLTAALLGCSDGDLLVPPVQGGADLSPEVTPAASPTPSRDPNLLLPDLETLEPSDMYIQRSLAGRKELRFATIVVNSGEGPLTMLGVHDAASSRTHAIQIIATRQGPTVDRFAGSFVLHASHGHWHFEDFIQFELWSYRPDGAFEALLATSGKLTFCIFDTLPIIEELPNVPEVGDYVLCGQDLQGISVGWGDLYESTVPGQHLDIEGVPNGRYALRQMTDPDNRLVEINETNNDVVVYVEIAGLAVKVLDGP